MDTTDVEAGDLEAGDLVVIEGDLRLVRSVDPGPSGGKHGTAKVEIVTETLRDGAEETLTQPEDSTLEAAALEPESNPLILVGGEPHFDPPVVRITTGGTVVWLWDDDESHELAAEDGALASDREAGEGYTFEHAFDDAGVYPYACAEHEGLGVVVVE